MQVERQKKIKQKRPFIYNLFLINLKFIKQLKLITSIKINFVQERKEKKNFVL